jgi:hypothetical protein
MQRQRFQAHLGHRHRAEENFALVVRNRDFEKYIYPAKLIRNAQKNITTIFGTYESH